jgi:hypothetical protein
LHFQNGSIPTEKDFADLIDSMLIQDAGISKQPGKPLNITAEDNATEAQTVINFYEVGGSSNISWSLQLNPVDLSGTTHKPGFCIADGLGNPRLFIDKATGNVGIGTITPGYSLDVNVKASGAIKLGLEGNGGGQLILTNVPNDNSIYLEAFNTEGSKSASELLLTGHYNTNVPKITLKADLTTLTGKTNITGNTCIGHADVANPIAMLDIAQAARSGTQPTAIKGLYVTGDFQSDSDGVEFRHTNATQGIGFGYNTIYAAGSLASQDLNLKAKGTGTVQILGIANISDSSIFNTNKGMQAGSLTIGSASKSYGGDLTTNTAGLLMTTSSNTEIAVNQSGKRLASLMYYESSGSSPNEIINNITIGRDMGSGYGSTPVTIANNLTVNGVINSDVVDNSGSSRVAIEGDLFVSGVIKGVIRSESGRYHLTIYEPTDNNNLKNATLVLIDTGVIINGAPTVVWESPTK